ncbi:SUMF1/EgtB/PvdO family nonheme iron enzyme [Flavivirga spongiicola]|uniref:SUMF1/EgtB/PvdO family nonheme iron enzyme n=1 Tax=Flavivirga spongiicola TaxID=421621 RepID=A0ABU7Y1I8_9FLAO|nr:SUMF1/EgtB/PvdO family nonheme iron enzyme [Flavivirga sp. MEBiC05379]MDO5981121.1 SUMF1/EgtB/PvdO family nonheme iron enzyme [Flavivirga sp. MEBiC05379]
MLKSINLLLVFLMLAASGWAQTPTAKKNWSQSVIELKKELRKELGDRFPVNSKVLRKGDTPEKLSVDITGVENLVMISDGTEDGNGWDHAVWADVKLFKADGSFDYVDALEIQSGHAGYWEPLKNINGHGKKLTIQSKVYDHGIFLHADGEVVFNLNEKYVRFEALVGIDDGSNAQASVRFVVQNVSANIIKKQLVSKFPKIGPLFFNMLNISSLSWLMSDDCLAERTVVNNLVNLLDKPEHFENLLKEAAELPKSEQLGKYLELFKRASEIYNLQNKLKWINPVAIRLAFDNMKLNTKFKAFEYQEKLDFIEKVYATSVNGMYREDLESIKNLNKISEYKDELLLANPLLDFDKIIAVRYKLGNRARKAMAPEIGTQSNNWSSHMSARKSNFDCELSVLSNLRGDVQSKTIYKPINSAPLNSLKLHWDADRLMFTSVNKDNLWQIFEMDLNSNKVRQLTQVDEEDLEFFDGAYLPSGKIVAASNIAYQGVPCVNSADIVGSFCVYDPKSKDLRRISFGQDNDWCPEVMNNGRLMQLRWEYSDITHYFSRIMLHMNPDGTNKKELYGSGSYWPNSLFDAKPLPGKNNSQFIGVVSGHHGIARSGRLVMFDPAKGRREADGVMQEIPYRYKSVIPEIKDGLVDDVWPQFLKPQVLSKDYFLVTAKLNPESLWGLYLVDVFDNVTLIAEFEGEGLAETIPVFKKETPPIIPDKVNLDNMESTVYIQDIYTGQGTEGIERGTIKELRVFAYEFAYAKSPSGHMVQGIQAGWDMKRILGTVPVEEDGSVIFKIPSNIPISMQPLDENGAAVQLMRSWVTGMPGEVISCTGCHEDQNTIAQPKFTLASRKTPIKITPPEAGVRAFTFDLEIQPILDRHCISCHDGNESELNFKDRSIDKVTGFGKSYLALHPFVNRQGPEGEMPVTNPMEYHVSTSDLIQHLEKGHKNVKLTDRELRTVYEWIDLNVPYHGTFKIQDVFGINPEIRRNELMVKYANTKVDWIKEIDEYINHLDSKGKIEPVIPEEVKPLKEKKIKLKNWPFDTTTATKMQSQTRKKEIVVDLNETIKIKLKYIPAGSFVMGANHGDVDAYPPSKQVLKKGFWMSEYEISNEQLRALFPTHDSRYQVQFWKDHTTPGYPANNPNQPAVRVSWEEAMTFCEILSDKTGLKISLPTESQWEWAARAGSDSEFWYGDESIDFSEYANLADMQLADMAVTGVDPKPMSKNNPLRPYFDYIPRSKVVDDGSMLAVSVGSYKPNPWGLYDMIGNVSEWTRSDYKPYPYKNDDGRNSGNLKVQKAVRGGSWKDRSEKASSFYRKKYASNQKVFNVGFRIIVEE